MRHRTLTTARRSSARREPTSSSRPGWSSRAPRSPPPSGWATRSAKATSSTGIQRRPDVSAEARDRPEDPGCRGCRIRRRPLPGRGLEPDAPGLPRPARTSIGMSVDQATATLEQAGFDVSVGEAVDSAEAAGIVAAQSPGAGKVSGGTQVTIIPSNGQGVAVPDVAGKQLNQAVSELRCRRVRQCPTRSVHGRCDRRHPGQGIGHEPACGHGREPERGHHGGIQPHQVRLVAPTQAKTALTALAAVGAVGAGAALWGIGVERYLFTVREHAVRILPMGTAPLRVLHLSDAHMAPWQRRKQRWMAALADQMATRPRRQHGRQPRACGGASRAAGRTRSAARDPRCLRARVERPRRALAAQPAQILHRTVEGEVRERAAGHPGARRLPRR